MSRRCALALLLLGPLARAEEVFDLDQRVRAVVEMVPTGCRHGGYGFAWVSLHNRDAASGHEVSLLLASTYGDPAFSVKKSVALSAGERIQFYLPLYLGEGSRTLAFEVDGRSVGGRGAYLDTSPRGGMSVLNVTEDLADFRTWYEELRLVVRPASGSRNPASGLYYGSTGNEMVGPRAPSQLPDQWQLLSGYDLVLIDGRAKGLDAGRQQVLMRHLAAGGTTLVIFPGALPPGALRELAAGTPRVRGGVHAFGRWAAFDGSAPLEALTAEEKRQLWESLRTRGGFAAPSEATSGYGSDLMLDTIRIPGLGEVPVRLFFLALTAFAILVGPVNYIVLKRRRRLMLLLVTVPLAGLLFTGALLGYGVFREGFGITGVRRSLTVLDQRSHEAVTCQTRTLFAGVSPGSLAPGAGTYLWCVDFLPRGWLDETGPHRLEIDMDDGGRIDGSILPSRTPTTLFTVTQGTVRDRLRFRRGGKALEALPAPLLETGARLLVRDFDGTFWEGNAGAPLRPAAHPDRVRAEICEGLFALVTEERIAAGETAPPLVESWGEEHLRPGSYLATFRAPPAADDLGLSVEYRAEVHVVAGLLAAEDIVE